MMFKDYHNQIKELRKAIRLSAYHKRLYDECFHSLKHHTSIIKKAETKLRKVGSGKRDNVPEDLAYLFSDWIDSRNIRTQKRKQGLIKAKITQIASIQVELYLKDRVASLWEEKRLFKGLKTQEKKIIEKLEKELYQSSDPKVSSIVPFIISIEDLTIDLKETEDIYNFGANALKRLNEAIKAFVSISDIPVSKIESGSNEGKIAFQAFLKTVDAYMYLCAFKNEQRQYADTRDLQLHLDSLTEFMSTFINQLVLEWTEHEKIRQSILYIRKTINIIEALLKGLNSKMKKIKSELSLTSEELNAILTRMDLN